MNPLVAEQIGRLDYEERLREAAARRRLGALPRRPARWRGPTGRAIERLGARVAGRRQPAPVAGSRQPAGEAAPSC